MKRFLKWLGISVGVIGLAGLIVGVLIIRSLFSVDYSDLTDQQIEQNWLPEYQAIPAIPFLEQGGRFVDPPTTSADASIDQQLLLSVLSKSETEFGITWQVLVETSDAPQAFALIVPVKSERERVAQFLRSAETDPEHKLLPQVGHRWISLEVLTAAEAELLGIE